MWEIVVIGNLIIGGSILWKYAYSNAYGRGAQAVYFTKKQ